MSGYVQPIMPRTSASRSSSSSRSHRSEKLDIVFLRYRVDLDAEFTAACNVLNADISASDFDAGGKPGDFVPFPLKQRIHYFSEPLRVSILHRVHVSPFRENFGRIFARKVMRCDVLVTCERTMSGRGFDPSPAWRVTRPGFRSSKMRDTPVGRSVRVIDVPSRSIVRSAWYRVVSLPFARACGHRAQIQGRVRVRWRSMRHCERCSLHCGEHA